MYRYYFIIVVLYVVMRLYNTIYNPTIILILQYTALVALGTQLARDLATIGLVTICKCQEVPRSAIHNTIRGIYIPIPRAILGSEPNRRPSRAHNMDMTTCQACTSSDFSAIFFWYDEYCRGLFRIFADKETVYIGYDGLSYWSEKEWFLMLHLW